MNNMTTGVCALCNHNRVIRSWPIDHGHGSSTWNIAAAEVPGGMFKSAEQRGLMVAYICQKCGFVMWFANEPGEIPIGDAYGTALIEGPTPK